MDARIFLLSVFMVIVVLSSGCVSDTTTGGTTGDDVCQESWTCTEWTECADGTSTRTCTDSNACGTADNMPIETRSCTPPAPEPQPPSEMVEAFLQSHGTVDVQFLKTYIPVIELLVDDVELKIRFMDFVSHGADEMRDNTRIHCIQEEQGEFLAKYLRCFARYGNQQNYADEICVEEAGADKEMFDECYSRVDGEFKLTETYMESNDLFPPYNLNKDLVDAYEVTKTPTLYVNGEQVSFKFNPDSIKDAVCDALDSPPSACNTDLSTKTATVGFGPVSY